MKPWWKSKTIWFNVLMALAAILTEIEQLLAMGLFDTPEWASELIILFSAIINIFLRTITDQGIKRIKGPRSLNA